MRPRGSGSIYRRGAIWWIQISIGKGRVHQESSGSSSREDAVAFLTKRRGKIYEGKLPDRAAKKVTVSDLLESFITDQINNQRRDIYCAKLRVAALKEEFGSLPAAELSETRIEQFKRDVLTSGRTPGTVNRFLATLRRGFRLGLQQRRIHVAPNIVLLREAPPRAGFFEPEEIENVIRQLPEDLRPVAEFGWLSGWRLREITDLQWNEVDFRAGTIRLRAERSKNGRAREIYFAGLPRLAELLRERRRRTSLLERERGAVIPLVFHRAGRRIMQLDKSWREACGKAGLPGMHFHDLRRSAARNLVRAGVPETVAMKILGHRTRSIFDRYNITSGRDLEAAMAKLDRYLARGEGAVERGDAAAHRGTQGGGA